MKALTSWEVLRRFFTINERKDSVGYTGGLLKAADIFILLNTYLNDWDSGVIEFNASKEIKEALVNKRGLDELEKAGVLS